MKNKVQIAAFFLVFAASLQAQERLDYETLGRIRNEGFRNSKVMETARELTDRIGPRLTGSPGMKAANEWTRDQLAKWGLQNAHLEKWGPFGRGWSYEFASARMTAPTAAQLYAIPKAWSPGTNGAVRGEVVRVKLTTKEDLEAQKGKLGGKIVLIGEMPSLKPREKPMLERHDEKTLDELGRYPIPGEQSNYRDEFIKRRQFREAMNKFAAEEKIAAVIEPGSGGDGGTFDVAAGGSWKLDESVGVPTLVMNPEHYARIARLLDQKQPVELEVEVRATYHVDDTMQYNTIAEIPGTDKANEIVMLGAHLDSWHGGTGATDNAAGSAAMMEAVRILRALDIKPRRTIRIALWSGEEQGLLGSRDYVSEHFGKRAPSTDAAERDLPFSLQKTPGALTILPAQAKVSAYFNMDNGTGKIRGIYAQENLAAVPIFERWIAPLRDLGVATVVTRNTSGTDHQSFDAVGIPGFQFIQDDVEYSARTHHSNADTFERLQREDLMQASVVIASFVYNAAMRDEMIPRKALPPGAVKAKK